MKEYKTQDKALLTGTHPHDCHVTGGDHKEVEGIIVMVYQCPVDTLQLILHSSRDIVLGVVCPVHKCVPAISST